MFRGQMVNVVTFGMVWYCMGVAQREKKSKMHPAQKHMYVNTFPRHYIAVNDFPRRADARQLYFDNGSDVKVQLRVKRKTKKSLYFLDPYDDRLLLLFNLPTSRPNRPFRDHRVRTSLIGWHVLGSDGGRDKKTSRTTKTKRKKEKKVIASLVMILPIDRST